SCHRRVGCASICCCVGCRRSDSHAERTCIAPSLRLCAEICECPVAALDSFVDSGVECILAPFSRTILLSVRHDHHDCLVERQGLVVVNGLQCFSDCIVERRCSARTVLLEFFAIHFGY